MKEPKKARFWIRFGGKTIDSILFMIILTLLLLFSVKSSGNTFIFKSPLFFYLWTSLSTVYLIFYFYCLPPLTNGYTLGFWIARIKIKYTDNPWKEQALRECTFSFIYVVNAVALMSIINHTLINDLVQNNNKALNKLGAFDKARVSFYITITSIGILISMVVGISIMVKKGEGMNDILSKSQAIYVNKFIEVVEVKENINRKYKPRPIKPILIEWIE